MLDTVRFSREIKLFELHFAQIAELRSMYRILILFIAIGLISGGFSSCSNKVACPTYASSFPEKPKKQKAGGAQSAKSTFKEAEKESDQKGMGYAIPKRNKTKSGVFDKGFFK
jgi:hypothetical protein